MARRFKKHSASARLRLSEYDGAVNDCAIAIQIDPNSVKAYSRLGSVPLSPPSFTSLFHLPLSPPSFIACIPPHAGRYALQAMGRLQGAADAHRAACELQPDSPVLQMALAEALAAVHAYIDQARARVSWNYFNACSRRCLARRAATRSI